MYLWNANHHEIHALSRVICQSQLIYWPENIGNSHAGVLQRTVDVLSCPLRTNKFRILFHSFIVNPPKKLVTTKQKNNLLSIIPVA